MKSLFVTLVLLGAIVPVVVSSDPSYTSDDECIHDPKKNPMSWMYNEDIEPSPPVLTEGHFHIWSLVSNAGDALLQLSQDKEKPSIECSGSFSHNPVQIKDTTVYPTSSLSIKFHTPSTREVCLSIHQGTEEVVAKDLQQKPLNDYDRFTPWLYRGFVMFESKAHPTNFLGCTKEGEAKLFHSRDKRFPDPRTLFVANSVGGN